MSLIAPAAPAGFAPSEHQRKAIETPLGPVLVLAGPGAGKTFCLIERIRFLIEQRGFSPGRICAVTFTNKAAQEIAERLGKSLGERATEVKGGTLHALCAELLREDGERVGARRGFGIADEEYQQDVLRRIGVWPGEHSALLQQFGRHRIGGAKLSADEQRRYSKYRDILDQRNLLDFDDLIVRTDDLLRQNPDVAERVARRWDYILVDEFQDLNARQYAIVRRLAELHRNLFAVGDDEQSVFSWTGADPRVLLQFLNDFRIVGQEIVLDENRRTARQIFESARRLLGFNPPLFQKGLRAERSSDHVVLAHQFGDDRAEARWLLADLQADQAAALLPWGEYGVLYRRHEMGDLLEAEFVKAGIPCRLASKRALQDHPVVRYLVAALRVIRDPQDPLRQEAFARVVLPEGLWSTLEHEAKRHRRTPLECIGRLIGDLGREHEDTRKLKRASHALGNLRGLAHRHRTLTGLVEELLSQRVGEYRTVLETLQHELSDPAKDAAVVALSSRLGAAFGERRTIWLPRMGGLELALSGMLQRAGAPAVNYLDPPAQPGPGDLSITPAEGGRSGLALGLFKALQIVSTSALQDGFRDFVSLDIETSDFATDTCEIIELGAVRVRDGKIVEEYQQLVRPARPISPAASAIHHLEDADLRDLPTLAEVWPAFRRFCGDDTLVAHNGNGFDFKIIRRLAGEIGAVADFATFDSLPLARQLHPGSRRLEDLAHAFGIPLLNAHRALPDARALVPVFQRLQQDKVALARKTALSHLLDWLALALALSDPATWSEEARDTLFKPACAFALGRYSDCLEYYQLQRASPGAVDSPPLSEVIRRLGGQRKLEQYRKEKSADERYPAAMARLRRLLEAVPSGPLAEQLPVLLDRIALSRSDASEGDPDLAHRVNLLTLHSTKGLEFSRVYIVGVEDAEMPRIPPDGRAVSDSELQESRRLLYVGMTRAKDRLVLTRAAHRRDLPTGGIRFLTEMGITPTQPD